jgi:hypothetical protein
MKPQQTVLAQALQFLGSGIDARYEWCVNSAISTRPRAR